MSNQAQLVLAWWTGTLLLSNNTVVIHILPVRPLMFEKGETEKQRVAAHLHACRDTTDPQLSVIKGVAVET